MDGGGAGARKRRPAARATRKADLVAHDLLQRVVSGDIAVGSLLPREDELATRYDVNRSVVREAIKLLEVHRLVEPTRRRGTEVLDPLRSLSPEVLRAMLQRPDGRIDRQVLAGLLEIRAGLDAQMTELAALRRDDADLEALDALVARLRAARDPSAIDHVRLELPILIARATKNPIFEMLAHWNELVVRDLDAVFGSMRPTLDAYTQGIALLVDLIRRRDPDALRSLVGAYHAWATPRLLAAAALASGEPLDLALPKGGLR
ncbi:FadR/GntR family transcriptional regulator [Sandaracinus amylolyticus]|uniref:FadR/GntR family transcriptional regulator n=1 Tax=Sandaracinus amylolyticus TaxID=927083 RepID=UPI001F221F37|nr:GntR family transcriptional regulator [Sandaracinus amylolyticus]UJR78660.1 FadR family transcriptional regulator [Sandaracinus amylolyticus]